MKDTSFDVPGSLSSVPVLVATSPCGRPFTPLSVFLLNFISATPYQSKIEADAWSSRIEPLVLSLKLNFNTSIKLFILGR